MLAIRRTDKPEADRPVARKRRHALADAGSTPSPSPARLLQEQLSQSLALAPAFVDEPVVVGKWSKRRAMAFAIITSAALWGGIGSLIYAVTR